MNITDQQRDAYWAYGNRLGYRVTWDALYPMVHHSDRGPLGSGAAYGFRYLR